jgi:hypothetical protein
MNIERRTSNDEFKINDRNELKRRKGEGGNRRTEDRRQKTEDRGQKTEDRRQKTEDRRQKTEDRRHSFDCRENLSNTIESILDNRWEPSKKRLPSSF